MNYRCRKTCKLQDTGQIVLCQREGVIEALLNSLKYKYRRETASVLIEALSAQVPDLPKDAVLVPIPTAPRHIRERGFDHIDVLSKKFAYQHNLQPSPLLSRRKNTRQVGRSRAERWRQTEGLFYVRQPLSPLVTYIVFDDVVTTGATMLRAVDELRAAGAQKVVVLALMHQPW